MNPQKLLETMLHSLAYVAPELSAYCVGLCLAIWLKSRNSAGSLTAILALVVLLISQLMAVVAFAVVPQMFQNNGGGEGIVGAMWLVSFIHSGVHGLGILALVGAVFQSRHNDAEAAAEAWEN